MKLSALIDNQEIRIDTHQRWNREVNNWDNNAQDIHLEKRTLYKINGKKWNVIIKIPLNSDRKITILCKTKRQLEIPPWLKKEIEQALQDNKIRQVFIWDLKNIINNYSSDILDDDCKLLDAIQRIESAFGVPSEFLVKRIDKFTRDTTTNKRISRSQTYKWDTYLYTIRLDEKSIRVNWKCKYFFTYLYLCQYLSIFGF